VPHKLRFFLRHQEQAGRDGACGAPAHLSAKGAPRHSSRFSVFFQASFSTRIAPARRTFLKIKFCRCSESMRGKKCTDRQGNPSGASVAVGLKAKGYRLQAKGSRLNAKGPVLAARPAIHPYAHACVIAHGTHGILTRHTKKTCAYAKTNTRHTHTPLQQQTHARESKRSKGGAAHLVMSHERYNVSQRDSCSDSQTACLAVLPHVTGEQIDDMVKLVHSCEMRHLMSSHAQPHVISHSTSYHLRWLTSLIQRVMSSTDSCDVESGVIYEMLNLVT